MKSTTDKSQHLGEFKLIESSLLDYSKLNQVNAYYKKEKK